MKFEVSAFTNDNSKEIYIDNKLVGYISFDEYDDVEGYNKVLGFGNFMILERDKGYGTKAHMDALRQFGPCPVHRKSFIGFLENEHE